MESQSIEHSQDSNFNIFQSIPKIRFDANSSDASLGYPQLRHIHTKVIQKSQQRLFVTTTAYSRAGSVLCTATTAVTAGQALQAR